MFIFRKYFYETALGLCVKIFIAHFRNKLGDNDSKSKEKKYFAYIFYIFAYYYIQWSGNEKTEFSVIKYEIE